MRTVEELNGGYNLGDVEVLPAKGLLRREGEEVHPEPQIMAVLMALAQRDGDLVTKDELYAEAWDGKVFGDEPLLRSISVLRKNLGDKKPFEYIETLQRRGYRLLKPVELHKVAETPAAPNQPDVRRWKIIAAVIATGFVAIAAYMWAQTSAEPEPRSLAILQIENLSGNPENQYIVAGIKNTLAQRLSEIPNFTIKNTRRDYLGEPAEIAAELNVENVLFGSVQLQNGEMLLHYEIVRGSDGVLLLAGEIPGKFENLFQLQERFAKAVRDELAGEQTPQLITRLPPDSTAYASYMRGMYALELRFAEDNLEEAIELFQEAIRLDESYGPPYLALATAYALLPDYRDAPFQETRELAISTIDQGIAVDPSITDAAVAIYGFDYHQKKEWKKSESAYQRAISGSLVDSNAFSWYSRMLASVGRLEESLDAALRGEKIDPRNAVVISRIAMAYTWVGEYEKAYEYFARANELGATGRLHVMAHSLLLFSDGQAEESRNLSIAVAKMSGQPDDWIDPVYDGLGDPGKREAALAAIDRAWSERWVIPDIVLVSRVLLGDADGAMEIAHLLEEEGEEFSTEMLFISQLAPLRQHPDFVPLLERLGIVAYWNDLGCTWDGDRVHCPTS